MKILLADDHVLFRDALTQFINALRPNWMVTTVSNFDDAYHKIEQVGASYFDILLLDIRMPGMDGLNGLERMITDFPQLKSAIISGIAREVQVRAAMQMGAVAYFPKTLPGKSLITAIHLVANGEKFIPVDEDGTNIMPSFYDDAVPEQDNFNMDDHKNLINQLTRRERDVIACLIGGSTNAEISEQLGMQLATVKLHVGNICRKINAKNRTQAALMAQKAGIEPIGKVGNQGLIF